MSTEAQTSTPARKPLPLYKRRRRRIYGAAALVLAVIVGVVVWATTGGSWPAALPSFTISVSQGSVASPDSIIESQPSLAKLIPAHLHYVPFEAGVTAIAEMKSGAVQAISGVGNPPVTEAIGNGTGKPLWYDALTSLRRILIGFTAGTVIGVALGAGMSASRLVRHAINPVIEVLRPLPPLAFIPLFIIWLGIGEMPKEVLIIIGVIPIMAVTTVAALDEVPDDLRLCARTLGASPRHTMLRVQIRSALPGILTGMRIAMAGAWTSIVAAELIAATGGLGYLIMQAGDYLNTALVFSGIIMIAILGLVLDACLRGLLLLADPSRRR